MQGNFACIFGRLLILFQFDLFSKNSFRVLKFTGLIRIRPDFFAEPDLGLSYQMHVVIN